MGDLPRRLFLKFIKKKAELLLNEKYLFEEAV